MDYRAVIQQSLDYIEDNLRADITAEELAGQAGFSLYHYYRLFQAATGLPVMQYILRRRLLHGIYAIRQGSGKTEAALEYGFDTYAGFYKAFRREFDCPPSAFLKSCRAHRPYRINLMQEEHIMITQKKAAQILRRWGMEDQPIRSIYYESTGRRNENVYDVGGQYVLKFTAHPEGMNNHIRVSKAIRHAGLMAAVPLPAMDGAEIVREGELYFCLFRRLEGKPLTAAGFYGESGPDDARLTGEAIGRLHQALSGVEPCVNDADLLETVAKKALPQAKAILGLSEEFCRTYLDTFGTLYARLPRQVIHRDPNPSNIIRSDDQWGFIDFELSERNARIYDPCYAATAILSETFGRDNDRWLTIFHRIIEGYDAAARLTPEEKKAVPYVLLANQLICVSWFAGQDKFAEQFQANKRMTLWLLDRQDALQIP